MEKLLFTVYRGTVFDQMLTKSLIISYVVSAIITLFLYFGKNSACQNMLLCLINYFFKIKSYYTTPE